MFATHGRRIPMKRDIRLFAAARSAVQSETVSVELPSTATVADVRRALQEAYPELSGLLPICRFAIDHDYVNDETVLTPDREVAVIPPVSGG